MKLSLSAANVVFAVSSTARNKVATAEEIGPLLAATVAAVRCIIVYINIRVLDKKKINQPIDAW